ncbi:hypothetical protein [Campylobacter ureolyticus]|nr:hypothetical protein [Campylobacter ureolyticus]
MRNKFKENMFMKDKLIEHLRKKENHYKDRAYFKNLYMYWAMYLLVFIIPNSIFEILPFTKDFFICLFSDIPLLKNLLNNPKYPDYVVFYVCLISVITIIFAFKLIYDYFYFRIYEFGMFDIYKIKNTNYKKAKDGNKIKTFLIVFIIEPIIIGVMIWSFYFYNGFLESDLFANEGNISNLFQTRFGAFFMMVIWQGFMSMFVAGYPVYFVDCVHDILKKEKK